NSSNFCTNIDFSISSRFDFTIAWIKYWSPFIVTVIVPGVRVMEFAKATFDILDFKSTLMVFRVGEISGSLVSTSLIISTLGLMTSTKSMNKYLIILENLFIIFFSSSLDTLMVLYENLVTTMLKISPKRTISIVIFPFKISQKINKKVNIILQPAFLMY